MSLTLTSKKYIFKLRNIFLKIYLTKEKKHPTGTNIVGFFLKKCAVSHLHNVRDGALVVEAVVAQAHPTHTATFSNIKSKLSFSCMCGKPPQFCSPSLDLPGLLVHREASAEAAVVVQAEDEAGVAEGGRRRVAVRGLDAGLESNGRARRGQFKNCQSVN